MSSRRSRSQSAPWDRSPVVRGPRYPPSRGRVRTVATCTVLDSTARPVAWTSRLPWEIQPRPLLGDPPLDAPHPYTAATSLHGRGDQDPVSDFPGPRTFPPRPSGRLSPPQPPPCGNNPGHHPSTTATTASSNNRRGRCRSPSLGPSEPPGAGWPSSPHLGATPNLPPQPSVDDLLDFDE
ncbi:hypothetical protein HPB52_019636 [Rhipicephalus sanguineus]|uniref:Uncharacterized protein n=1 Tax=Rhipicephalus sanguineus TaxID=34632 RepID=A0A9D4T2K2_RHISA|nr:hypothetical protein HPB52_019636 [Rhipicephalus sanguineus]